MKRAIPSDKSDKSKKKRNIALRAGNSPAHDRTKILIDTLPFACHLWDRNYEMIYCNEENAVLFKVHDKYELMRRFSDFYPEYQPDGQLSADIKHSLIRKAFDEGKSFCPEFIHIASDGTPLPSEITLVSVAYEDDLMVAAYIRNLNEHKDMMGAIRHRDNLLSMGNRAANALLTLSDEKKFESSLAESMEHIGLCIDLDRIYIMKNETVNGERCFVYIHEWINEIGREGRHINKGTAVPYSATAGWGVGFAKDEVLNGPVRNFAVSLQNFMTPLGIKSVLVIPIYIQDYFWGLISYTDCRRERSFTDDEVDILRSSALMMISALLRNTQISEIREAHERTKLLLDSMPLSCRLWNRDLEIFEYNEESLRLFNVKDGNELIDRYFDLSPEYQPDGKNSKEKAIEILNKAFDEGRHVLEWTNQTLDGITIPTEINLVRVAYEGDYVVAGYTRDLREHKKMMQAIEKRDYLLNTINDVSGIMLQSEINGFAKDLHNSMKMLGQSVGVDRISVWKNHDGGSGKGLCYSQIFEWRDGVEPPEDKAGMTESYRTEKEPRVYREKAPDWERQFSRGNSISVLVKDMKSPEYDHFSPQGLLSIFAAPVFINNNFWGFVSYDNYNCEHSFTEDEQIIMRSGGMVFTNALLRNEMTLNIRDYSDKLEDALKEAQKSSNAKSDFLANMSHEMRTPLNAIIGLSELSLESDRLSGEDESNLEKINSSGATLLGIVNDILDISKIEAGKMELVTVDYAVPSLINDTITQNIMRIGEKPIRLKLDLEQNMFMNLHGDELRVKKIMNNLLSNAIKYTDEGEVELSIRCIRENGTVWLIIKVSDTGRGIKPDNIAKLFSDYAQLDLEYTRQIEGTGLGLPITKKLAEMMNGSVEVESEYGKGSVFTVRIAQKFISEETIGQGIVENLQNFSYSDSRRSKSGRLNRISMPYARVLVVDDNVTNLDVAKGLIKPYGIKIDCATSGQQSIDIIQAEKVRYDAIFMDHMMPGMDGIEAANLIREIDSEYARNIPVIALTANAIAGNEQMFLEKGFQAFLSKPIDTVRLDEVLRHWVRDKNREIKYEQQAAGDTPVAKSEAGSITAGIKIPGLDIQKGVKRFSGDEEMYLDILKSYADETSCLLEKIKGFENENDKEKLNGYAITVHGMKGSSRGICAESAGDFAEKLEKAAKLGDYGYISENNAEFVGEIEKLIGDIKNILHDMNADKPKPIIKKPNAGILKKLGTACRDYDMDCVDRVMDEILSFRYESDGGLAEWLDENVKQMNFKEIAERLSSLDL